MIRSLLVLSLAVQLPLLGLPVSVLAFTQHAAQGEAAPPPCCCAPETGSCTCCCTPGNPSAAATEIKPCAACGERKVVLGCPALNFLPAVVVQQAFEAECAALTAQGDSVQHSAQPPDPPPPRSA